MIETFVFSSECLFLREEDQVHAHQLLDYLKSRKQQVGMVFYDQATMNQVLLEHHLADYLDFSINGEEVGKIPQGLIDFLQVELKHQTVNFISNSLDQLQAAEALGFAPIYLADSCYKEEPTCQAFSDFGQLHLGVIAHRFEKLT
ncbi:hypothetical protein P7H00_04335 [Enterococcus pseudoavium]|uniref:Uncharacterized protein n=1 Tax=Enterococcus pseudoavium TaxID=44007 RepID=A0AAE4L5W2_9ENTE|nr:hypothetical protein [Enterococcus pseudoavium]MDT2736367.1 hypothetical protein [Enterococcus pseudoavium]MDT2753516.1 hypothetical protein [Enterococcus pseudoavium]MDT2770734.1 hypothetical protein [Enterococcus pseudoavium]REC32383.1 hypothetical protein CF160_07925 [Enterococcus pseudoavium]